MRHLTREPLNLRGLELEVASPSSGAVLTFAGTVRDEHLGRVVIAIDYHAYESMAEKELARIETECSLQ